MGPDAAQNEISNVASPSAMATPAQRKPVEAPVQRPKKKRGRPRKNKDPPPAVDVNISCELPSEGVLVPLPSPTLEDLERIAYESALAPSTHVIPPSNAEMPPFPFLPSGLPAAYPDPYSNSDLPVKDQSQPVSPVVKRRRGRPPKNQGVDKNSSNSVGSAKKQQEEKSPEGIRTPSSGDRDQVTKRPRGRPKGSGKSKKEVPEASGSRSGHDIVHSAAPMTCQVLQISPGEDIVSVITSFCQKISLPMCVVAASGAVGYIDLKHEFSSRGGSIVYQGIREILSMSGYFIPVNPAEGSWSSRFSVVLADPSGTIIGGSISSSMVASSKVQVVLGSFISIIQTA